MSERAIQAGDLVAVVRASPCCGFTAAMGHVFVVDEVSEIVRKCRGCGIVRAAYAACRADTFNWVDVYRLRRIPPLSDPESTQTRDEREKETT